MRKKFLKLVIANSLILGLGANIANPTSASAETKVETKATNPYSLSKVVLVKGDSKIQMSFIDYALMAGNTTVLNGYSLKYVGSQEGKYFTAIDYAMYFLPNSTSSKVLENLTNLGKNKELTDVVEGKVVNGKVNPIEGSNGEDDNEDYDVISID